MIQVAQESAFQGILGTLMLLCPQGRAMTATETAGQWLQGLSAQQLPHRLAGHKLKRQGQVGRPPGPWNTTCPRGSHLRCVLLKPGPPSHFPGWRPIYNVPAGSQIPPYYPELLKSESEVTQSCPTLCDPLDCSLPGSSIHGIFQARALEWVAISFSRRSSLPRDRTQVSHTADRCFTREV